jgi:alpha-L-rhamnosidase
MRKTVTIALLALLSILTGRAGSQHAEAFMPTDLRCEYLVNPLGIDSRVPRLSWKLESGNLKLETRSVAEIARGVRQRAYQILVASSEELLKQDKGDLWDSGKVESAQSVNVEYAGKSLTSNQRCFWKVRVWIAKLETGNWKFEKSQPSAWSKAALFSMGLLDPSDWEGEWIRFQEADNIKHIWYRKTFSLDNIPEQAFAYLASIGYHELYVNGERIGDRVLSPGVTDLEKRALYVTYDIKSKLKKGDNVIAVWTGPGWARSDGSFKKGVWKQDSIFKCQVNFSNGLKLHTDSTWKCQVSSSENLGLWKGGGQGEYGGELIDARRHIADWNKPSTDDSGWSNATCKVKSLILSAEMQEPDRKVATLNPVTITETNGAYRIDFGRNFTGWFEIDLRNGKAGQMVKIMTANRKEETLEFKQESQYIFDSAGKGTFSHRFNYMAGRWVTIEGLSYKPEAKDIRGYIITNDRKRIGHFECSNPLFNEIYETDLRTYIACSVNGVTMDCPHRERFGYGEIALACTWGCAIPNFESAPYYRKVARDWFDVQRADGFVNTIAPHVYKGAGGTLWSSAPVTMSWEFYKAYGDKRQLGEAYEPMKKWLDFLNKSVSSNGVLVAYESASRFLGDWATPHGSEYGNIPAAKLFNNCVYAYCLDVFVQAATVLGKSEDVTTYSARLANLRTSAHAYFYNEATKNYIDGRQLSMAFPLYTSITPAAEREAVLTNFVAEITQRKPYLDTGSSGLPILLKYLIEDAERADLLYTCLTRTDYPSYGYFLKSGETAWPEYWKIEGEASRIHTCYTGIAGYFMKALGGIRPDPSAYGMQKVLIKPKLVGTLTWVKSQHESLYGLIVSNWTRAGDKVTLEVTIPPNTTATVFVPANAAKDVEESGKPTEKAAGVLFKKMEGGCAVFEIGSGSYMLTSTFRQDSP